MLRLRSKIQLIASVFCIGMLIGLGCASEKSSAKSEMQKLQGTWQLVYQQVDGKQIPDERAAKMFHGKMIFAQDKIRYSVELPGFDFELTYKLHPERQPKWVDLQLADTADKQDIGERLLGIYLLEKDTLKICHSMTNRPVDFSAGEGSHNVLIVLKRKRESSADGGSPFNPHLTP